MERQRIDGIGQYTRALVEALDSRDDCDVVRALYQNESLAPGSHHFRGRFLTNALRARFLAQGFQFDPTEKLDLYHATDHRIPRLKHTPVVATLHDAVPFKHPEWANPRLRRSKNWLMRQTARWADHVICDTESAVAEVVRYWGVPERKISVVHLGVDQQRFTSLDSTSLSSLRMRMQLPEQFVLFIGTLQPRKNLTALLEAHMALPEPLRKAFPLVIAGRTASGVQHTRELLLKQQAQGYVKLLGYVDDEDVPGLYQCATLFALPSLHEGFGMPVLEAFASGAPVICSGGGAMQEIAGDAACFFDPESVESLRSALHNLLADEALRQAYKAAGQNRVRQFSWQQTAKDTLAVYQAVLSR